MFLFVDEDEFVIPLYLIETPKKRICSNFRFIQIMKPKRKRSCQNSMNSQTTHSKHQMDHEEE